MEISFRNDKHLEFVCDCLEKAKKSYCYHKALFYVLGLTEDCQNNINELYNWNERCINPEAINSPWVTGTDARIIRLAYNLFNDGAPTAYDMEDNEKRCEELMEYLPTSIFSYLDHDLLEYALMGVKIRFS